MRRARPDRAWAQQVARALGLALLLLAAGCRDPGTGAHTALTEAEVLEVGASQPAALPPADAAWRKTPLPDNWDGRRPGYQGYVWYRLRLDRPAQPGSRQALYLPVVGMNAEPVFNGVHLGSQGRMAMPPTRHFYTPLLFDLPAPLWRVDGRPQELLLLVAGHAGYRNGLGVVHVGSYPALYEGWRWRRLWQNHGTLATSVFNIALGLYVLLLAWGERGRGTHQAVGWFGIALLVWGLRNLNLVLTEPPLPDLVWAQLATTGAVAFTGLFSIFAIRLSQQEDPGYHAPAWLVPAIVVFMAAAGLMLLSAPGYALANARFATVSGIGVGLGVWGGFRLVRLAWRQRTPVLVTVALASIVYVALMLRDIAIALDRQDLGQMYLRQYAAVPLFAAIALLLARRYLAALARARELSESLKSQVAAQRDELQRRFDRLHAQERMRALADERARLTRDLHDSLGMHLVSALRQARRGASADAQTLASALQDCLDDLRVVIDSLDNDERDPLLMLGTLRFRLAPRFEAMGIRLGWQVDADEAETPLLPPDTALELLRITQEALTNALKHSGARVVTLGARMQGGVLEVWVADDGQGCRPDAPAGRGLRNMQGRARRIGAHWTLDSSPAGCTVRLVLRCEGWLPGPV